MRGAHPRPPQRWIAPLPSLAATPRLPSRRISSGARRDSDAGGGRGGEAARGPGRPPRRSPEGKGARSPAAPAQDTGGAQRGSAPSTRRAGEGGLCVRLGPQPAKRDPACPRYSQARPAAAPAFVPGGKPPRGARVGLQGGAGEARTPLEASSASKCTSRPRGRRTGRFPRIHTFVATGEPSTWASRRPVTLREVYPQGPLPSAPRPPRIPT